MSFVNLSDRHVASQWPGFRLCAETTKWTINDPMWHPRLCVDQDGLVLTKTYLLVSNRDRFVPSPESWENMERSVR